MKDDIKDDDNMYIFWLNEKKYWMLLSGTANSLH